MHKIGQSGQFLGRILSINKNSIDFNERWKKDRVKPIAKSVLISLGLTAATKATDAAVYKKRFHSGMATSIISNEEIVKSLQ